MRIATNTPFSFPSSEAHDFVHVARNDPGVELILLVLPRNWGGAHVRKIIALKDWIARYPSHVPCFIVGAESTIPDDNLEKYRMPARDEAIGDLCNEVLQRSASIGVRGTITYRHLVELVGLDRDKVDVVYAATEPGNTDRMRNFLVKNRFPVTGMVQHLLNLQANQDFIYEPPVSAGDEPIRIMRPYLTEGTRARVSADIRIDGEVKTLWCEVDAAFKDYLLHERSDAFLLILLPLAMRMGKDILCDAPVSELFLHHVTEILIPQLTTHDPRLHPTRVIADADPSPLGGGTAVGTAMSCGVDSLYTTRLYLDPPYANMKLTHLYVGNYLYGNDSKVYSRARRAAELLNLTLVSTYTNVNKELALPHTHTHFFKAMFGVICLRKLFRVYYYSTSEDFSHFTIKDNGSLATGLYELLLLYVCSMPDFQIITGGVKTERLGKTEAIVDFAAAQKLLNVCLSPELDRNCGRCEKCRRTLLMLDLLGALDKFRETFDIDAYLASRMDSFLYLVRQKNSIMLSETYRRFLKKEPLLIREAERLLAQLST